MTRLLSCSLIIYLLLAACADAPKHEKPVTETPAKHPVPVKDRWYKRYTGTLNGEPVMVMMCSYGVNMLPEDEGLSFQSYATCDDERNGRHIDFRIEGMADDSLICSEFDDSDQVCGQWALAVNGTKAMGRRTTKKGTEPVSLQEDYSQGAYPLSIVKKEDSCSIPWGENFAHFDVSLITMAPGAQMNKDDAGVLQHALVQALDGDSTKATNIEELTQRMVNDYVTAYRKHIAEEKDSNEYSSMYDHQVQMTTSCIYNGNGLLGFKFDAYSYEGGAHGNFNSRMVYVDMKEKKSIRLSDILAVDSTRLNDILRGKAMEFFNAASDKELDEDLLVTVIPPTDNIIISGKGITFYYNQYEIAGFAMGQVILFVPYKELGSMVKPEFIKRMNLLVVAD